MPHISMPLVRRQAGRGGKKSRWNPPPEPRPAFFLLTEHVVITWFCVFVMFLALDDYVG
jgi:hypothetical protein